MKVFWFTFNMLGAMGAGVAGLKYLPQVWEIEPLAAVIMGLSLFHSGLMLIYSAMGWDKN